MQSILNVWLSLNMQRRVMVVLATALMFGAVLMMARMATSPSMALLYNGLEPGAAGDVVRALEQRGAVHEIRGGAIYVTTEERDQLRMTLASEGLPANSTKGYELLDNLTGFGTTAQMFDAAYWRAKEGELARTIMGSPKVSSARVHISQTGTGAFQRQQTATASVTINTIGGDLSVNQIRAFKFLVASAVAGLDPQDVAIIDGATGLLAAEDNGAVVSSGLDRAEELRQKVQRLLEARVGRGNAVVEVAIETVSETETIRERTFDPETRVAISTDTEQRSTNSQDNGNGDVTVASNLPDGDAAGGNASSSENSESRERVNYEVSETERQITRQAGDIKRLTVAVLVNYASPTAEDETDLVEREASELAVLQELVASAVGFDEARGDIITLKSLPFEPVFVQGSDVVGGVFSLSNWDLFSLLQATLLALVALVLGLFVLRPIFAKPPVPILENSKNPIDDLQTLSEPTNLSEPDQLERREMGGLPAPTYREDEPQMSAAERLRGLIGDRQDETVEILRAWMDQPQEKL